MTQARAVVPARALRGEFKVPGDKSLSHRALILAALADGETEIWGLSTGQDVRSTRRCLEALGARVEDAGKQVKVHGRGLGGLAAPSGELDCGNSGTTMRLLMGVAAGHAFETSLTGDASLRRRPMARVADPLRAMGASVGLAEGGVAPLKVRGGGLRGTEHRSPAASAQVKSAVLLAGLHASGTTTVVEPSMSRDHTERLLGHFEVAVERSGLAVSVRGGSRLKAKPLAVPGDPSSAAFWLAAACLVPGSKIKVLAVCANPTRLGFVETLRRMGARLTATAERPGPGGEPVCDLSAEAATLEGVDTAPEEFPSIIDEVPLLAVVAARAVGTTRIRGIAELRHKESDRAAGIVSLLAAFGAEARLEGDDLIVRGPQALRGGRVDPLGDHRLAMAGAIAALAADGGSVVLGAECADISYPGFFEQLGRLS